MFKRQKMLDTQKIMTDMTQSLQIGDDDSLNLQITGELKSHKMSPVCRIIKIIEMIVAVFSFNFPDILEQLSRCTTGSSSE